MILQVGTIDAINNRLTFDKRRFNIKDNQPIEPSNRMELMGVPRSYISFRGKDESDFDLPDESVELMARTMDVVKRWGHSEIHPAHILQASIEETEDNFSKFSDAQLDFGAFYAISVLNKVVNDYAKINVLKNEKSIEFFKEMLGILKSENEEFLKTFPKDEEFKEESVTISKTYLKKLNDMHESGNRLTPALMLGIAIDTLTENEISHAAEFLKGAVSYGNYADSDETMQNYMNMYDSRAIDVWNKLALGSNLSVIYSDPKECNRIIASLIKTINDEKHGNFNSENTQLYILNERVSDKALVNEISLQKEENSDENKIFIINLDQLLANSVDEKGEVDYGIGVGAATAQTDEKNKIIFLQSKDVHYKVVKDPVLKSSFNNFITYTIPNVQAYEVQKILKGKSYKDIVSKFTKEGRERAIYHSANMSGIFPDKTIDLMNRITSYYSKNSKKIAGKDVDEFAKIAYEIFEKPNDTNVVYDTGKTLSMMYGKETIKKDIEAIIRQIKTGRIGTRGMIIYSEDPEAGSGRRYVAETIAGETKIPFVSVDTSTFAESVRDKEDSSVDTPKYAMKRLFEETKQAARQNQYKTAVLYIENFEDFAFSGYVMPGYKQAMSQLSLEMKQATDEDVNILVIGSTDEYYAQYLPELVKGFNTALTVDSPASNKRARKEILINRIKETNLPILAKNSTDKEVLINKLVKLTARMSFVEIKSLVDKTKQIMFEREKQKATLGDFIEAYLQIATGRTSHPEMPEYNKQATTSHECGHATNLEVMNDILARKGKPWHLANDVNFITLDPRGNFLGAVFEGKSENTDYPFEAMFTGIVCAYGGYSCEKRFFDMNGSIGISQDLVQATGAAKQGIEMCGFGYNTGKISNAFTIRSQEFQELVYKDLNVILKNAQLASDLITECYKDFNKYFTNKFSKLIGTDECMIDGDDFRKLLNDWKKKLSPSKKEELSIMDDMIMDIIDASKKGKLYGKLKAKI